MKLIISLSTAVFFFLSSCNAQCPKTSPLIGSSTKFTQPQDGLVGSITVIDDCSFKVNLSIKEGVPDIYFWYSATSPDASGKRASETKLSSNGYNNAELTITLTPGTQWAQIKHLYIWCESFKALIGNIEISTLTASTQCAKTSPLIGSSAKFTQPQDGLVGSITVIDDCSFKVNLSIKEGVPDIYFWYSATSPDASGKRASQTKLSSNGYNNAELTITLTPGTQWAQIKHLYIWCESFKALIGNIEISTLTASTPSIPDPLYDFTNCETLAKGAYNLYWSVNSSFVEFGIESLDDNKTWHAIGLSDPAFPIVQMIGSDPVVTGSHQTGIFANPYSLSALSQCGDTGSGVCKSSTEKGVTLIGSVVTNGVRLIRFRRPLTGGKFPYNPTKPASFVWAYGPLSEDATKPVVLYHGSTQKAASDFKLTLSTKSKNCSSIASTVNKTTSSADRFVKGTEFEITTGPNPNYPNPPGWGFSYYVNGVESPTIIVKKGATISFTVRATDSHPFYITSSKLGGKKGSANGTEIVYAGDGGIAKGGEGASGYKLMWTVPADFVEAYYQCYDHQKLGWKITTVDNVSADGVRNGAVKIGFQVGLFGFILFSLL